MDGPIFEHLSRCLRDDRPAVVVTVIAGPGSGRQWLLDADGGTRGHLGDPQLGDAARPEAEEALRSLQPKRVQVETRAGTCSLFVDVHPPRRRLIVIGGVHVAIPLLAFARTLGMHTAVVDPRTAFATRARFPEVDEIRNEWPDEAFEAMGIGAGAYVVTLSHDDKLDVPALAAALRSPARYVGALGSRKTHAKRVAALTELGFGQGDLARIHNPIGLPLGGRRAEEIAVSILAEMVTVDHGTRCQFGGRR